MKRGGGAVIYTRPGYGMYGWIKSIISTIMVMVKCNKTEFVTACIFGILDIYVNGWNPLSTCLFLLLAYPLSKIMITFIFNVFLNRNSRDPLTLLKRHIFIESFNKTTLLILFFYGIITIPGKIAYICYEFLF